MKRNLLPFAISSLVFSAPLSHAQLPQLGEKPWLGHFIGIKEKKFQFGITSKGDAVLHPLKRDGTMVALFNPIKVNYEILETMPDGKVVSQQVKVDSLASAQPPVEDPKLPVTFTGKVTGDAAFEMTVAPERGGFSLSGKVTDKGSVTNPLQFVVTIDWNPYRDCQRR